MLTCPRCGFVAAFGSTIHCLRPTCGWARPISKTARRRLIADVLGRTRRKGAR